MKSLRWLFLAAARYLVLCGLAGAAPSAVDIAHARHVSSASIPAAGLPISLNGVVTGFSGWQNSFFLQDGTDAISIDREEQTPVGVGDRVQVHGRLSPGLFAPVLISTQIEVKGRVALPPPRRLNGDYLSSASLDSKFVEMDGIIQAAQQTEVWGKQVLVLTLSTPLGPVSIHVLHYPVQKNFSDLIDAQVRVRGICGTVFNDRQQRLGSRLFVSELADVHLLSRSPSIDELPITPISGLSRFDGPSSDHRVKVQGVITYIVNSREWYLQDGESGVRVKGNHSLRTQIGETVTATGFPSSSGEMPELTHALVEHSITSRSASPAQIHAVDVFRIENGFSQAPYNGLLVTLEGVVVQVLPAGKGQAWLLRSGRSQFQVHLPSSAEGTRISLEPDAKVRVTGVCLAYSDEGMGAFRILVRSVNDIQNLNEPYWSSSLALLVAVLAVLATCTICLWMVYRRKGSDPQTIHPGNAAYQVKANEASRLLSSLSGILALVILLRWTSDLPISWSREIGNSMPNAALGFLFASAGVWFISKSSRGCWSSLAAAAGCALIGLLTLFEYVTSIDLHIDTLLIHQQSVFTNPSLPGRMAVATSLCLVLSGVGIACLNFVRLAGIGQIIALGSGVLSLLNLIACLYGNNLRFGAGAHATMSLPSCTCLVIAAAASLLARVEFGPMRVVMASTSGGLMARRMIPVVLAAPVILGWIRLQGQIAGMYDTRFGLALFALLNIMCFGFLVWGCAASLNRLDVERTRAQDAAIQREKRLEMVFRTAGVGDWTWDAKANRVEAHPVVWDLYGTEEYEGTLPGMSLLQHHSGPLERIAAAMAEASDHTGAFDVEFRVQRQDGSFRWISCRGTVERDARGHLLRATGINFDITKRKVAELQTRESEERFRKLADAMPQIVWTSNANNSITYYNRRWYSYTGLSHGADWDSVVHPDDLEGCKSALAKSLEKQVPFECEVRLRRAADGAYRWHLARAVPVSNSSGEIQAWFGTSTDVDDFNKATDELRRLNEHLEAEVKERTVQLGRSERQYRLLLSGAKDYAIVMLDTAGAVVNWNSGAEQIFGYTSDEAVGKHFSLFHTEADRQVGKWREELILAERKGRFEEEAVRSDKAGKTFWADVVITPLFNEAGLLEGFCKVTRDVSERKAADALVQRRGEELAAANAELSRQTERAEEASRAKSNFLAAMSHEIRTPMNSILGLADLLWETALSEVQREYVRRFRRAGGNLLTLINDILDLSKVEAGHFDLENITFDLHDLLERTLELLSTRAQAKQIELQCDILPGTPQFLEGDPGRIQQILNNLIGNAIKFTEAGGVRLRVGKHPANKSGHLYIEVVDTGIGIPADKTAHIFQDFTQAEASTARRFGGTGLGLGICRRLVQRMGGQLDVKSALGQGSTFYFDLRLRLGSLASHSACSEIAKTNSFSEDATEREADRSHLRLLVAEDSDDNRFLISSYLKDEGYQITFADNGEAAVAQFDRAAFDVVLMDMQMPVMDGLTAAMSIRELEQKKQLGETPILALTANALPEDVERSRQAGCNGHLSKPISKAKLIAAVESFRQARLKRQETQNLQADGSGPEGFAIEIPDGFEEVSRRYIEKRSKEARELVSLVQTSSFQEASIFGHNLKGNGVPYGFPELTMLGAAIEQAANESNRARVLEELTKVQQYIDWAAGVLA